VPAYAFASSDRDEVVFYIREDMDRLPICIARGIRTNDAAQICGKTRAYRLLFAALSSVYLIHNTVTRVL
jgi:hypothetical protein